MRLAEADDSPRSVDVGAKTMGSVSFPGNTSGRQPSITRTAAALLVVGCVLQAVPAGAADEQEWGTVKFRIRCPDAAANNLPGDGSLEVDLPTGGVANVFFWVRGDVNPVHPAYRITERDTVTVQFNGDRIQPRAATYRMGQSLVFQSVFNDTHGPVFNLGRVSALLPPGASMAVGVPSPKQLPQEITCVIHPKTRAYLKILEHPYGDVTDADGSAVLQYLPVGRYEVQFWHERIGFLNLGKAGHANPATAKGRMWITVTPGETELGEFVVPRSEFR
jgi:hypothetical protein